MDPTREIPGCILTWLAETDSASSEPSDREVPVAAIRIPTLTSLIVAEAAPTTPWRPKSADFAIDDGHFTTNGTGQQA